MFSMYNAQPNINKTKTLNNKAKTQQQTALMKIPFTLTNTLPSTNRCVSACQVFYFFCTLKHKPG